MLLLANAYLEFDESNTYGSYSYSVITTAEIYAPIDEYEHLTSLSVDENRQILQAILDIWPPRAHHIEITGVTYRLDKESLEEETGDTNQLLQLIEQIQSNLITVSTGGPSINSVNQDYKERHLLLTAQLLSRGLQNPVPYSDLWDWYGKWSSGDLPTYRSRREYIRGLLEPLEKRVREGPSLFGPELFSEPTGWTRVDRTMGQIRDSLEMASNEEQFQVVGLLCREALISLAQTVFDSDLHPPIDNVSELSKTDAKRMLERYFAVNLSGQTNEVSRKCARASLDLANDLQHRRTAAFRQAALCAEATSSVINIVAILSGVRDP